MLEIVKPSLSNKFIYPLEVSWVQVEEFVAKLETSCTQVDKLAKLFLNQDLKGQRDSCKIYLANIFDRG